MPERPVSKQPPEAMAEPTPSPAPPLDLFGRLVFRLLVGLLWLARRLPDKPLYRAAFAIGAGVYLLMPERRDLVRSNLQRVCTWLVEQRHGQPPRGQGGPGPRCARSHGAGDLRALGRDLCRGRAGPALQRGGARSPLHGR